MSISSGTCKSPQHGRSKWKFNQNDSGGMPLGLLNVRIELNLNRLIKMVGLMTDSNITLTGSKWVKQMDHSQLLHF